MNTRVFLLAFCGAVLSAANAGATQLNDLFANENTYLKGLNGNGAIHEIQAPKVITDLTGHTYCAGIVGYKNRQANVQNGVETWSESGAGMDPPPVYAYAFWAAKLSSTDLDHLPLHKTPCDVLTENPRPALVFLHPYYGPEQWGTHPADPFASGQSLLGRAGMMSLETGALVVAIAAPGMGFGCSAACDSHPECLLKYDSTYTQIGSTGHHCSGQPADMISWGEPMTGPKFREGFEATPLHPRWSLFYGYAHSAMRAVTMIRGYFDSSNPLGYGGTKHAYTNGLVGMTGDSAGGVTTLLVNGYDDRLQLAASNLGLGGWKTLFNLPYNWMAKVVTASGTGPNYTPYDLKIACDDDFSPGDVQINDDDVSPAMEAANAVCRMANYEDPALAVPQLHPVLVIAGLQDDVFPVNGYMITRSAFLAGVGQQQPVFTAVFADWDHWSWYLSPHGGDHWWLAAAYDNAIYGAIESETTRGAFLAKGLNNSSNDPAGLGDFGDWQAPAPLVTESGFLWLVYTAYVAIDTNATTNPHYNGTMWFGGTDSLTHYNFYNTFHAGGTTLWWNENLNPPGESCYAADDDDDDDMLYPNPGYWAATSTDYLPTMYAVACPTGYGAGRTCSNWSYGYASFFNPALFGAYGDANYEQSSYVLANGDSAGTLYWRLTGDINLAGTSGFTAETLEPGLRCYIFADECNPDPALCDWSKAPFWNPS